MYEQKQKTKPLIKKDFICDWINFNELNASAQTLNVNNFGKWFGDLRWQNQEDNECAQIKKTQL